MSHDFNVSSCTLVIKLHFFFILKERYRAKFYWSPDIERERRRRRRDTERQTDMQTESQTDRDREEGKEERDRRRERRWREKEGERKREWGRERETEREGPLAVGYVIEGPNEVGQAVTEHNVLIR